MAWGQPIEYIESLDNTVILELQALNVVSPFTPERQANQLGVIASLLFNQNATKKSQMKTPSELFPYLQKDYTFLMPDLYLKAKAILDSLNPETPNYESQLDEAKGHIRDTIEIEEKDPDHDRFLIRKLKELL